MNILVVGGRRTRARARVEDRSVAARREGVRGAGKRRHGARAGLTNCPGTAIADLVAFAAKEPIALTIVGPEAPLAAGIVDAFRAAGLRILRRHEGRRAARSSKGLREGLHGAARHSQCAVPDLRGRRRGPRLRLAAGRAHRRRRRTGLAAGKGVVIAQSVAEAHAAIDAMIVGHSLGDAGARGGDRGLSRRRRGELHRHGRRAARAAARVVAGSQAVARP